MYLPVLNIDYWLFVGALCRPRQPPTSYGGDIISMQSESSLSVSGTGGGTTHTNSGNGSDMANMAGGGGSTTRGGGQSSAYRDPATAPMRKLSVDLIKTYKHINEVRKSFYS